MPSRDNGGQYSTATGLVYVFNLIVGTGALALPSAFSEAGWVLSIAVVAILGLVSYITVTFILESLAVVNAVSRLRKSTQSTANDNEEDEGTPLVTGVEVSGDISFDITDKFEITEMATVLLSKYSKVLVFVCLVLYLLGDLSIYAAVVGKTMSHVTCTYTPSNVSCNETIPDTVPCWATLSLTRADTYKIYVSLFVILLGPFAFFNLQKTKVMQIVTSCMRSLAFGIMIIWSIQKLAVYGVQSSPAYMNIYGVPTLFGTCVYSFMCQHSIPGLVQPIANKHGLKKMLIIDYMVISFFYIILSLTAIFTFPHLEDVYTLNFWSDSCNNQNGTYLFLDYYLALFPVFTLSTSFPIISITLKNNLKNMFVGDNEGCSYLVESIFPLVTITFPLILALTVSDLSTLFGVVGSYAGAGVQYLIPCILVTSARSHVSQELDSVNNPFASKFSAKIWVIALYLWMTISLVFITIKYVTEFVNNS